MVEEVAVALRRLHPARQDQNQQTPPPLRSFGVGTIRNPTASLLLGVRCPPFFDFMQGMQGSHDTPVVQGYLEKLHVGLFRAWQRRWFRIEGDKLMYYKDKEDLEHLGWIDLSECTIDVDVAEEVEDACAFAINVPGRRYLLKASKREHKGERGWRCNCEEEAHLPFTKTKKDTWVKALVLWSGVFQVEKRVTSVRKSPRGSDVECRSGDEHARCLARLLVLIESIGAKVCW